jgi:hypothetical protein
MQKASFRVKACLGNFCSLRAPHGDGDGFFVGGCGRDGCLLTFILIPFPPIGKKEEGAWGTKKSSKRSLEAATNGREKP